MSAPVWTPRRLARLLDHSVLSPVHTEHDVFRGCRTVRELGVLTILVKPSYVRLAVRLLEEARVNVGTVIGFPHGGETIRMKAAQVREMRAAGLAAAAGAHFIKTSTGYGLRGATVDDVRLLRQTLPRTVGVKASGGIKTLAETLALLEAGASRIGTSSTSAILAAAQERQPVHA